MFILDTISHRTLWGGGRLNQLRGLSNGDGDIGHLYSLIMRGEFSSRILSGPLKGVLFSDFYGQHRGRFGLTAFGAFPFSIALVDARLDLSIQVHPYSGGSMDSVGFGGKAESYFFLRAPDSGFIYNGCLVPTVSDARRLIESGAADRVADRLAVRVGDYVTVHPGTLHALTGGSLVYEIEENFDVTYRIYDFLRKDAQGRQRDLQIDAALSVLKPDLRSVVRRYPADGISERTYCSKFVGGIEFYLNRSSTLEFCTLLSGTLVVDQVQATVGSTIVLEPLECISLVNCTAIVSRASDRLLGAADG